MQRLQIDLPFAGQAERRVREQTVETARAGDDFDAAFQASAEKGIEREAEAAGGTRSGNVAAIASERRGGDAGDVPHDALEPLDLRRRRALLRRESSRRTVGAA